MRNRLNCLVPQSIQGQQQKPTELTRAIPVNTLPFCCQKSQAFADNLSKGLPGEFECSLLIWALEAGNFLVISSGWIQGR